MNRIPFNQALSVRFRLQTRQSLSYIGIDAPLFSYFPVCIRKV